MKKFGTPNGAGPGTANENVGLDGVGTPFAVYGGGGCSGCVAVVVELLGPLVPVLLGPVAPEDPLVPFELPERLVPLPLPLEPDECDGDGELVVEPPEEPDEPDEPDEPEEPDEPDGTLTDGVLTDGVLIDGVLTDGVLTDGVLTDGTLTDGSGDDEESAGGTAIAVSAPNTPAPTDATNHFLPLDTSISCRSDRPSRRHNLAGAHREPTRGPSVPIPGTTAPLRGIVGTSACALATKPAGKGSADRDGSPGIEQPHLTSPWLRPSRGVHRGIGSSRADDLPLSGHAGLRS
jgi:hypothetical protein